MSSWLASIVVIVVVTTADVLELLARRRAMKRRETSASIEHWVDTMVVDFAASDPGNPK